MVKVYPSELRPLKAVDRLDDATLLHSARLVRACAEIESLVARHLMTLAGLEESVFFVVLGKVGVQRRIEMVKTLSKFVDKVANKAYESIFDANWRESYLVRNAIAHGRLCGIQDDGIYVFESENTSDDIAISEKKISLMTIGIDRDNLRILADRTEAMVKHCGQLLGITTSLGIRPQRVPRLHPKGAQKSKNRS